MEERDSDTTGNPDGHRAQSGTAMIIALMVMGLLAVFVATSLTRVTTEARIMGNDHQNTRAFYAAQAGLELMSRDFAKIFLTKFAPTAADITAIQANEPVINGIEEFDLAIRQTAASEQVVIEGDTFDGLVAIRDPWRLNSTATTVTGEQVQLTRTFFNNRIPIFQFGIFYDDDMEFHPGPVFNFGGRVHGNASIFMAGTGGVYFNSKVTAHKEIVTDRSRSGSPVLLSRPTRPHTGGKWADNVYVRDAGGTPRRVTEGSVIEGWDIPTRTTASTFDDGTNNLNWPTFSQVFNGFLRARQPLLQLPLQIENNDPIELVKRPRPADSAMLAPQRYANKACIRVYLGDSTGDVGGGIRLDGNADGLAPVAGTGRGYWPRALVAGAPTYARPNRLNAHRLFTAGGRQAWIKIEVVTPDLNGNPVAVDHTADFLSLGVTKPQIINGLNGTAAVGDENAIFVLQRFGIDGPNVVTLPGVPTTSADVRDATARPLYRYVDVGGGVGWNVVQAESTTSPILPADNNAYAPGGVGTTPEERQLAVSFAAAPPFTPAATTVRLVPFPIRMFDTREGLYHDTAATPTNSQVPYCGVMGVVEIEMNNLVKFMAGAYDGRFPGGLTSASVPDNAGAGIIVYVSDRRGDADDDGVYDMENIYVTNFADDTLQPGEDVGGAANVLADGVLQADYANESLRYNVVLRTDMAAFSFPEGGTPGGVLVDRLFRRSVRLVNGERLRYNAGALSWGDWRKGVTVASEQGVYIQGNYNASGINPAFPPSALAPTADIRYIPYADEALPATYTSGQVPASVVSDAVTILSRNWRDGRSFASPFNLAGRVGTETTVRTALLMGDTKSAEDGVPNGGGGDVRMSGGVHNFKRFLETWGTERLNYCGSLINLFNSRNSNGSFKCCNRVYGPPNRNWIYDETFLDPDRMPPGTPFFQYVQMTGFRRTTF